jgi:hypothetical protein
LTEGVFGVRRQSGAATALSKRREVLKVETAGREEALGKRLPRKFSGATAVQNDAAAQVAAGTGLVRNWFWMNVL